MRAGRPSSRPAHGNGARVSVELAGDDAHEGDVRDVTGGEFGKLRVGNKQGGGAGGAHGDGF